MSAQLNNSNFEQERSHAALRRYEELKFEIAKIAQVGMQLCREVKDDEGERLYRLLLTRIAEDSFNVAVLGLFSRGKSTLMNAILGMDRLPTGVLPHTSVITAVTYGTRERVVIHCAGRTLPQEVPLERLADYVTEEGNPSNQRHVRLAEIQLPSQILRRGFHFIDTPGVGSGISANTEATEGFIPEVDAAVFVSSFDSPLDETQLNFLRQVYEEVGRIFVVINKLDLLAQRDRDQVICFLRRRLDSELGPGNYGLFALSAKEALEAKLRGDEQALVRSGLPSLERALTDFLNAGKVQQFFARTLGRLGRLLRRQQLEATIAITTGKRPELAEQVRQQFSREIEDLSVSIGTRSAWMRTNLVSKIAGELDSALDVFFHQLQIRTRAKFLPCLTKRSAFLKLSRTTRTLEDASVFCEQAINQWITTERRFSIEPAIERIGGQKLKDLKLLPNAVAKLASKLAGIDDDGWALEVTGSNEDEASNYDLAFPELPHTPWSRRPPLWLGIVPFHWFEAAVGQWFDATCYAALRTCRQQIENAIQLSAAEYFDRIEYETRRRVKERAARIAGFIGAKERAREAAIIDNLLRRATLLRQRVAEFSSADGRRPLADDPQEGAVEADAGLGEELCPICVYAAEVLFAFLSKLQYNLSASEATQASHAEIGGFCPVHTWMYSEMTSPQGICNAYPLLLSALSLKIRRQLDPDCGPAELAATLEQILRQNELCSVCGVIKAAEQHSVKDLFSRPVGKPWALASPPTLCLPHLYRALAARPDAEVARVLCDRAARGLDRSAENMRRYALKHDAVRRNLLTHEERIAYLLGLARVASDKRLVPRWAREELGEGPRKHGNLLLLEMPFRNEIGVRKPCSVRVRAGHRPARRGLRMTSCKSYDSA